MVCLEVGALGELGLEHLGALLEALLRLEAHDAAAPLPAGVGVGGELGVGGLDHLGEGDLVGGVDGREREDGGLLLVHELAEEALVVDDGVRDAHLAAEGGEPHDELHGVNVGGDDDELGLLLLDGPCRQPWRRRQP